MAVFRTEGSCINRLELLRWPKGIVCPLCGSSRKIYTLTRGHVYKCGDCGKTFSIRKGTIFEESRLPLRKWFAAFWLITSNRDGINSSQLARKINVTQKTAWLMLERLREVAGSIGSSRNSNSGTIKARGLYWDTQQKETHRIKGQKIRRSKIARRVIVRAHGRSTKIKALRVKNTG